MPTFLTSIPGKLVVFSLFVLILSFSNTASAADYEETACPFDTSSLVVRVRCGILTVPENRLQADSRQIVLMVMIAESPNPDKSPDPVVYLTGGPGESAIAAMVPIFSSDAGLLLVRDRDWIVVDQRGTGYSVPRLDCNIFGIARLASTTALMEASSVCYERYNAAGIDLNGYTTAENAADIAALREAMGHDEWNLFGVSYGTTLALSIMDLYPLGVRSVILDSTLPPQRSFFLSDVENKLAALERLFEACRQDAACNSAYPDLAERFDAAVQALNEQPLELEGLQLNGDFLVFALTNTALFQRDVIQQLPAILDSALNGDIDPLAALLGNVASGADSSGGYESDLVAANDGMGLAMNCSRDALFPDLREQLIAIGARSAVAASLSNLYLRYLDACEPWNSALEGGAVPEPVQSDIPTLFFVGEWDPSTPLALAQETAETLTHNTIVVFPGQGHSILLEAQSDCAATLFNDFLAQLDRSLNTDCVATAYPPLSFSE
ncbi:MAG: alpha/beta fold hydrolase [Chloroflexota bacterium]|nr:alpha/beta fold hydrolase [Chloroflexota bacterium]